VISAKRSLFLPSKRSDWEKFIPFGMVMVGKLTRDVRKQI